MTNTPSEFGSTPTEPSTGPRSFEPAHQPSAVEPATWPPSPSTTEKFGASISEPDETQPTARTAATTGDSTADTAKEEAAAVKDTAVAAGKDVAATAQSEAAKVVGETKQQARTLFASVTDQVSAQAGTQQQQIASQVQSLSQELTGMASGSSESGPLTDLAHQAGQRGGEIATWLSEHEPRDVLREVQSFARRRPVTFLVLCGLAGVVAGRLTRGAVAANTDLDNAKKQTADAAPAQRALTADPPLSSAPYATVDQGAGSGYDVRSGPLGEDPALGGVPASGSAIGGGVGRPGEAL